MVQAPPAPLTTRRMLDCTELLASFTVGRDRVAELLPRGFRFGNTAATALRADRDTSAEVLVSVTRAAESRDANGDAAPAAMALGLLVVEPPHDLELTGADLQAVCLFSLSDSEISIQSEALHSGDERITVSAGKGESVELGMTCYVSSLGVVHVPPRRSRIYFQAAGEVEGIHDLVGSGAVGSPSGLACAEIEGVPTLPAVMEGTAVRSSGFDARVEPLLALPDSEFGEAEGAWARWQAPLAPQPGVS